MEYVQVGDREIQATTDEHKGTPNAAITISGRSWSLEGFPCFVQHKPESIKIEPWSENLSSTKLSRNWDQSQLFSSAERAHPILSEPSSRNRDGFNYPEAIIFDAH